MGNTGSSSFSGTRKVSHRHTRGRSAKSNNNTNNNNTEGVKEDVSTDSKRLVQATSISATNNRVRRASSYVAPSFNKTRKARKNTRGGGGRKVIEEVKPKYQAEEEEEEEIDDSI
jgi:hypothetical protein